MKKTSGFYIGLLLSLKVADEYHQQGKCFSEHKQLYAIQKTIHNRMTLTANCKDYETNCYGETPEEYKKKK